LQLPIERPLHRHRDHAVGPERDLRHQDDDPGVVQPGLLARRKVELTDTRQQGDRKHKRHAGRIDDLFRIAEKLQPPRRSQPAQLTRDKRFEDQQGDQYR